MLLLSHAMSLFATSTDMTARDQLSICPRAVLGHNKLQSPVVATVTIKHLIDAESSSIRLYIMKH